MQTDETKNRGSLGTFAGVFTPSILTILGIILFLRVGYIVGAAGLNRALVIIVMANTISILTSLSLSAVIGRARLLAASDDAEGAIAAYLEALDPRSWEGWPAVASRTMTLLELARLEDEVGDTENARLHYQEYLDHWGDADPPVVAAPQARARLAEL